MLGLIEELVGGNLQFPGWDRPGRGVYGNGKGGNPTMSFKMHDLVWHHMVPKGTAPQTSDVCFTGLDSWDLSEQGESGRSIGTDHKAEIGA